MLKSTENLSIFILYQKSKSLSSSSSSSSYNSPSSPDLRSSENSNQSEKKMMQMELPMTDRQPVKDMTLLQFQCTNCDLELVHKIAQLLIPGLSTACVDNVTGDPFRSLSSVVVDLRKEMVDYLTERSKNFITESILGPDGSNGSAVGQEVVEVSDDPAEIISDFMDDFAELKRNLFSRVSGWLLSESREDKIDDFGQEMEMNNFWPMDRREAISAIFIKNVDLKTKFHCGSKFENEGKLNEHLTECNYRKIKCENEGCRAKFSYFNKDDHSESCGYKTVECEQKCGERILRREMDRHCITVCKMRMVNCPFYSVGCESACVQIGIPEHCEERLGFHVLCVIKTLNKKELFEDKLKERVQIMEKSESWSDLAKATNVKSLTKAVKELESKLSENNNVS